DVEAVLKAAAREGSSAFLWGTVEGAIQGAATETLNQIIKLTPITKNVKDAIRDKTGWSDDILSQIGSTEEADIYQKANLREMKVNGRTMLVRTDINLDYRSELGGEMVTNLERMRAGYAPIDAMTGQKIQLHHVNQEPHGVLAMLTEAEHQGNAMILNREGKEGVQRLLGNSWNTERKNIWRAFAELMGDQ
ncbi:MAG: HNH/ENDO VII family nuclease, partial [bacterium]